MDAREHDLLEPRRAERIDLREDLAGREAPTRPPRHRDDAERAEEVAPLLDLEKRTRLSRERARPERAHGGLAPDVTDDDPLAPALDDRRDQGVQAREPDHVVD